MVLEQQPALRNLFKYQSGRVIALGRVMLGIMFLVAVSLDQGESRLVWARTYAPLVLYALLAVATAAITWRNWWLDARLAVFTHAIDMAVFTAIVFSANGTTSPFFLFFVLPLLSAAIRWSWRETAITATALILLYLIAQALISGSESFELERFVIRAGNLLILSLLLIWFGIHQSGTQLFFREDFEAGLLERENPLVRALVSSINLVSAAGGALVLGSIGEESVDGFALENDKRRSFSAERPLIKNPTHVPLVYDLVRNRALTRPPKGRFRFLSAADVIDLEDGRRLGMSEGLVAEVRTSTQQGWLVLWDIPELSTDYIDLGRELGRAASAILERHALLSAIESGAAARTRLSLARDVHDGIVQFLAGAAFRVEAIKRAGKSGAALTAELDEMKRLLIEEQGEIRGFVTALRRDRDLDLADAVSELRSLAERLSLQWSVDCRVTARTGKASIPIRLQLDLQQLLREAVANAVRHGNARRIDVGLEVADNELQLNVADDGSGFPGGNGKGTVEPWSLKERVERARGSIRLDSAPGSTNIHISLPLSGASA